MIGNSLGNGIPNPGAQRRCGNEWQLLPQQVEVSIADGPIMKAETLKEGPGENDDARECQAGGGLQLEVFMSVRRLVVVLVWDWATQIQIVVL